MDFRQQLGFYINKIDKLNVMYGTNLVKLEIQEGRINSKRIMKLQVRCRREIERSYNNKRTPVL